MKLWKKRHNADHHHHHHHSKSKSNHLPSPTLFDSSIDDSLTMARRGGRMRDAALRDSRLLNPSDLVQVHSDVTLQKILQAEQEEEDSTPFHSAVELDSDTDLEPTEDTTTASSTSLTTDTHSATSNNNHQNNHNHNNNPISTAFANLFRPQEQTEATTLQSATPNTSAASTSTSTHSVRFDKAIYHIHPIAMGDNPSCMEGPPISIAWHKSHSTTVDLSSQNQQQQQQQKQEQKQEQHPDCSSPSRRPRRSLTQLHLAPHERDMALRYQGGYSRAEIRRQTRPVKIAQRQRRNTLDRIRLQPLHETLEKITRWWQRTALMSREERTWRRTCKEWTLRSHVEQQAAAQQQQQEQEQPSTTTTEASRGGGILRRDNKPRNHPFSTDAATELTTDPSSNLSLTVAESS